MPANFGVVIDKNNIEANLAAKAVTDAEMAAGGW